MTKIDWSQVAECEGAIDGARLSSRELERALYRATRDAFPINECPADVCDALEEAAAALMVADAKISNLGIRVVRELEARGLGPDGERKAPAVPYSPEDVAARSAHRPEEP